MSQLETGMRECLHCGEAKPLVMFTKDRRKTLGVTSMCIECNRKRDKVYRDTLAAKVRQAIRARRHYWKDPESGKKRRNHFRQTHDEPSAAERNPFKEAARRRLREAVRSGKIDKPDRCQECGVVSVIHGHHEDYTRPLDVRWLCMPCHGLRHRKYIEEDNVNAR